jgi:sarcosine oxidase, subunit beta
LRTANAVIVGGGIIGTSVAFHLARLGVKKIVLCERTRLAGGASGKSAAFIQMHMRTVPEAQLCAASVEYWLHWDEVVGSGESIFVRTGYLRMEPDHNVHKLSANVEMLRRQGINTRLITTTDARTLAPYLNTEGVAAAAYEPDGGYAHAVNATFGFALAAKQLGAEIMENTTVARIVCAGGRVTGVETTAGAIAAPIVVAAAGAWSADLFSRLGIELPVERARAQVALFNWGPPLGPTPPLAIMDGVRQVYYRPDGPTNAVVLVGLGAGGRRPLADPDTCREDVDGDYAGTCLHLLSESVSGGKNISLIGGRGGPINTTPDRAPIIDQCDTASGLFYILDSGRNFKTSPAIGCGIAEWATRGTSRVVDFRPFRASRFEQGDLLIGVHEYEDPSGDYNDIKAASGPE